MVKRKIGIRRLVVSALLGLFFACFMVFGMQLSANKTLDYSLQTLLSLIAFTVVFSLIFYFLINTTITYKENPNFKPSRILIFSILMALTIVFLLAMYPGNFCYDIFAQLNSYKTGEYTTHYPPAFCFIMGLIIDAGRFLFGSDEGGVVLFILIQAIITNLVITHVISELSCRLKNKTFHIVSCLYVMLHPFIFNLIISTCHDVFFADCFILLLLEFLKMSEDKDYFTSKKSLIKTAILTFLLCIIRNNGVFALIPAIIALLVILKGNRKKILQFVVLPVMIFLVGYNGIFLSLINVQRESILHESMNIPIMQLARSIYYDKDKVWDVRLNAYFLDDCEWHLYEKYQAISDAYKVCLKDEMLKYSPLEFASVWAEIGLKVPNRYIEAVDMQTLVSYYPWARYSDEDSGINQTYIEFGVRLSPEYTDGIDVARPSADTKLSWLHDELVKFFDVDKNWSKVPVFRFIWGAAFSTYLLIITIALVIYRKAKKYIVPLSFIFGMHLTVLLAPVIIFRYMFPVVLATPVMFYVIIKVIGSRKEVNK